MYRENIYDVMSGTGHRISKLIIPKNTGLKGYAWEVLREAGLKLDDAQEVARNKLRLNDLGIILKRGEDIPQLVMDYAERGEVVIGVTGDDLFDEYRLGNPNHRLKVENTYDWLDENARFKRPALCLINGTGNVGDVPLEARVAINGKYQHTSGDYLTKSPEMKKRRFERRIYFGDVEITVAEGTSDCCIDVVYSGETIDANNLKVIEIVRFSDIVAISPLKRD